MNEEVFLIHKYLYLYLIARFHLTTILYAILLVLFKNYVRSTPTPKCIGYSDEKSNTFTLRQKELRLLSKNIDKTEIKTLLTRN